MSNISLTPPTVRVTWVVVELDPEDVHRTAIFWPLVILPAELVHAPPLILYSPPLTDTGDAMLIPPMVTAAEVIVEDTATPDWSTKLNAFGVLFGATVTFMIRVVLTVFHEILVFEYVIVYVPTTAVFTDPDIVETAPLQSKSSVQLAPRSIYVSPWVIFIILDPLSEIQGRILSKVHVLFKILPAWVLISPLRWLIFGIGGGTDTKPLGATKYSFLSFDIIVTVNNKCT